MSPICETSKMPTPVRTALCSAIRPPTDGYSTGMSQPLKSTIFAPIWRWTAFRAVLRTVGVVAETADNGSSIRAVAAGMLKLITLTWGWQEHQPGPALGSDKV